MCKVFTKSSILREQNPLKWFLSHKIKLLVKTLPREASQGVHETTYRAKKTDVLIVAI